MIHIFILKWMTNPRHQYHTPLCDVIQASEADFYNS